MNNKKKKQQQPPPSTSSLKELKEVWYKKLEASGFNDIEADETRLKTWSSGTGSPYRAAYKYKEMMFDAKADYSRYAEHFLNEHKFKNERERIIWEYHTNGMSLRSISEILSQLPSNKKATVNIVRGVIKKLREKMFRLYGVTTGTRSDEQ